MQSFRMFDAAGPCVEIVGLGLGYTNYNLSTSFSLRQRSWRSSSKSESLQDLGVDLLATCFGRTMNKNVNALYKHVNHNQTQ